jgi:hypothetical protein
VSLVLLSFLFFLPLRVVVDGSQLSVDGNGVSVTGLVTTDESVPPQFSPATVRITMIPANVGSENAAASAVPVASDWSFQSSRIAGGVYVRVTGLPDEWRVGAVKASGRDVTDVPFEPPAGSPAGVLEVVLTRDSATLAGDVVDAHGAPAPGTFVLLFAEDARRWGAASRFVTSAQADGEGNFVVRGLPPGSYLATLTESLKDGWDRPESLQILRPSAMKLALPAGVTPISLRIEH